MVESSGLFVGLDFSKDWHTVVFWARDGEASTDLAQRRTDKTWCERTLVPDEIVRVLRLDTEGRKGLGGKSLRFCATISSQRLMMSATRTSRSSRSGKVRVGTKHRSPRSSVRSAPHPIPPLPGHLADQASCLHPGEVALDRRAAGAGQSLGHRGRDQSPLGQYSA